MVNMEQFREYLNHRKLRSVSIESYMRDVEQFCGYLAQSGIGDIEQVDAKEIRRYCDHMAQRGLASVSMQRKLASIKRFFDYLSNNAGQVCYNPVAGIQICKRSVAKAKVLSEDQLDRLLKLPDTRSVGGIRDKAMFALICSTGIKVSELIALCIGDICPAENCIRFSRQELPVTLQLDHEVCLCLNAYLALREMLSPMNNDALFLNIYGERITRQGVWKTLKKYTDVAGMDGITLETIRRSFARRYLDSGNDIKDLQCILGHSNITITRAYIKS